MLVIVSVLIAAALQTRAPAESAATRAAAVSAARAIGDAVEDFRKDHAGRPPTLGSPQEWPTDTVTKRNRGPINTYTNRPYMRLQQLDVFTSDIARMVAAGTSAPTAVRWSLQYSINPGRPGGWLIVVRDGRNKVPPCHVHGGSIALPVMSPC